MGVKTPCANEHKDVAHTTSQRISQGTRAKLKWVALSFLLSLLWHLCWLWWSKSCVYDGSMNICGWEGLGMSTRWLGMLLGIPLLEVVGWGGIYSHQPKSGRWWSLLAMGAPDSPVRRRTVSGAPPRHLVDRPLSWSTVGGFVLMWHWTVRCPSDRCSDFCCGTVHPSESTVARR
jgi:hypothetical protein